MAMHPYMSSSGSEIPQSQVIEQTSLITAEAGSGDFEFIQEFSKLKPSIEILLLWFEEPIGHTGHDRRGSIIANIFGHEILFFGRVIFGNGGSRNSGTQHSP